MNKITPFLSFCLLLIFTSCQKDKIATTPVIHEYLHLSHTRTNANPHLDSIAERIDYSQFDMLWLGGDLAQTTSLDDETMIHVDTIFDLSNETTLWALGNHDYTDLEKIEEFTKRPTFYVTHFDGITIVVLDTQKDASNIIGEQKDFLMNVLDTLDVTTHLILLSHKLIWMYDHPDLEEQIPMVSNANIGTCNYCLNPNNFNAEIYPELVKIKENGIEVLCIGGDIGFRTNQFSFLTPDGIHLLASGIEANFEDNLALKFFHDPINKNLLWRFIPLANL